VITSPTRAGVNQLETIGHRLSTVVGLISHKLAHLKNLVGHEYPFNDQFISRPMNNYS